MARTEGEKRVLGQRVVQIVHAQAVEFDGRGHALSKFVVEQVCEVAIVSQVDIIAVECAQHAQRALNTLNARIAVLHLGNAIEFKAADIPCQLPLAYADGNRLYGEGFAHSVDKGHGDGIFAGILEAWRIGKPCAADVVEVAHGNASKVAGKRHAIVVSAVILAAVTVDDNCGVVERQYVDRLRAIFGMGEHTVQIAFHAIVNCVLAHVGKLRPDSGLRAVFTDTVVDNVACGGAIEFNGVGLAVPGPFVSLAGNAGEVVQFDGAVTIVVLIVWPAQHEGYLVTAHVAVCRVIPGLNAIDDVEDFYILRNPCNGNGVVPAVRIAMHGFGSDAGNAARQYAHLHGDIERSVFARHAQHHGIIARLGKGRQICIAGGGHERTSTDGVFDAVARPVNIAQGHAVA